VLHVHSRQATQPGIGQVVYASVSRAGAFFHIFHSVGETD